MAYDDELLDQDEEANPLADDTLALGGDEDDLDEDDEENLSAFGMHVEEDEDTL